MPIRVRYEVDIQSNDEKIINPIIEKKRILNPWDLVNDTHSAGKAWDIVFRGGIGDHQVIPQDLIKSKG